MTRIVPAAGGVVWRPGPEVLVVHRPKYDDWSLPKGKLEVGENVLAAAVREVFEETGVRAAPQARLPLVRYLTGEPDVEKTVTYWSMRLLEDRGHRPDDEIDMLEWLPLASARGRLTYSHDRGVLRAFGDLPAVAGVVVLVRHASAGRRAGWTGPDADRPLDEAGARDAERAAALLRLFAPERVVSAPARRCRETVAGLGPEVGIDERLAEDGALPQARLALSGYAKSATATVVCSQGGLLRPLVPVLAAEAGTPASADLDTDKGTGWVLSYTAEGRLVVVDPLDLRAGAA